MKKYFTCLFAVLFLFASANTYAAKIFTHEGRYGLKDYREHVLLEPYYNEVKFLKKNVVKMKEVNKVGLAKVTKNDELVTIIKPTYDDITLLNDNYYKIVQNKKCGVAKVKNNKLIVVAKPIYENVRYVSAEDSYTVKRNGVSYSAKIEDDILKVFVPKEPDKTNTEEETESYK